MIQIGDPYDFAKAVRTRRRALGMTQRELALAAGLGRVSVLRLENEPEKCQLRTALRVAAVLRLNLSVAGSGALNGAGHDAALESAAPRREGALAAFGAEEPAPIEPRIERARFYSN
ncbi:MAG: helix-turn-helix transcriptional regulator [Pseudomonadota bacterium]